MQPAQQQAQPEVLPMRPPASARHLPGKKQPPAQRASCCRWTGAVAAALTLAGLSAAVLLISSECAFVWAPPVDAEGRESPGDILRNQFQVYHPKAQRFALHMSVGRIFLSEGRLADAAVHSGEALVLAQSNAQQVEARQLLALARQRQGRLSEARELLKAAVAIVDEDTEGGVLHALAGVRAEMGHYEAALNLYNRAFDLIDPHDADRAAIIAADIADAWAGQGRLQESIDWLRTAEEVLDVCRDSPAGADETLVAKVNGRIGAVRHRLGSVPSALESYHKALRTQARLLHASHPELVSTQLGVARARLDLGDSASALQDLEAVEAVVRAGPQEGLELSRVLVVKSGILREAKRVMEAEHAIQEAIRLQAALLQGGEHPEAALALGSHGSILHDSGNVDEAHEQYARALDMSVSTVGEKHPATAAAHNSLGRLFADLGDDDMAHEHFSKCLEIQLETLGKDSPDVAKTYNNLATVLLRRGQQSEAAELLELAI